jgi:hypothetical protein
MCGDLLHRGLLEASFQKYIERDIQELLVALLLLRACRPPRARARDRQIGVIANFLALQRKALIMERAGTIIYNPRMNERFQERKSQIKLVGHRASEAGITEVGSHEDVVKLLLPHTAYKSYPENWLIGKRWDRLSKWLDTVSNHRVPVDKVSGADDVDDWIDKLADNGFFVSCSSGTTGKSAMLVASQKDMDWCKKEAVAAYSWGSGVNPAQDRRMFGMAAVAHVARNLATGEAYTAAIQDPNYERFAYPVPPITVGGLTQMVVLRKAIADGTAKPADIAAFEKISAARQKAIDDAVGITAQAVVAARHSKIHVTGLWAGLYNVAKAVREMGYSAQDFHPENSIYVGGGLKRAKLPDDYREFVYETFNIRRFASLARNPRVGHELGDALGLEKKRRRPRGMRCSGRVLSGHLNSAWDAVAATYGIRPVRRM